MVVVEQLAPSFKTPFWKHVGDVTEDYVTLSLQLLVHANSFSSYRWLLQTQSYPVW